jgi:uncharacterized protein YlxW (UPF0749 family)
MSKPASPSPAEDNPTSAKDNPTSAQHSPAPPSTSTGKRFLRMARPRVTKANALAVLLAVLLGFAVATQVRQNQSLGLESLRQSDLVDLLDDATLASTRLDRNARELQAVRDQLASGSTSGAAAVKAAQDRLDALGILAGTAQAHGPGIRMTINDPGRKVPSTVFLDAIQELRNAGAEAIQVNGVRIVASSHVSQGASGVVIDGLSVNAPYTITAIGEPGTMASAMEIPGGLSANVRAKDATIKITQEKDLTVGALHRLSEPRYARPVQESVPAKP